MKINVAIVSDLHCYKPARNARQTKLSHLEANGSRNPPDWHPVESLVRLIRAERIRAQALIVPGDLTDRIDPGGLTAGWRFVREIAVALRATIIVGTTGNHDVDWKKRHGRDAFALPRGLHREFPVSCRSAKAQYWRTGFCAVESGPLRVLTVNSAFFHRSRRAADHGKISERQLAAIEDMLADLPKRRFQIGVVHHHPIVHEAFRLGTYDVIEGGTLLLDLLSEYEFDIVIHGHKHFPRLCYGTGESQSLPVFGAGSFSALLTPNIACSTRNLFHMLELDDDTMEHCGKHGVITSWEFHPGSGWLRPNNTSAALPATAGFGCHIELRSLARAVARAFRSCRIDVVRWERILILIPHLRFLVPCQLVKLAAHLRKHYGLQVAPPDQPNTIGLPHRP